MNPDLFSLKNKTAIVTGSTRGIGAEIAAQFFHNGACALFLASDASGFVTGHNLVVDGGTTISDGS